jgi:hypothetical protein
MPLRRPDDSAILAEARAECVKEPKRHQDKEENCEARSNQAEFVQVYLPKKIQLYLDEYFPPSTAFAWGFEGKLGYRQFAFFDPARLADAEADRWSAGAKAFGALYPHDGKTALTGSVAWEHGHTEGDAAAVCLAAAAPGICPVKVVGPPISEDRVIFSLGLRSFVDTPKFLIKRIGLAPTVNYEAKSDRWGVDLPVYLVPGQDGGLTGGLRLGYVTGKGEDDLVFGLFVGAAFSLFQ